MKVQVPATEAEYQATIVAAAKLAGWLVHAERPAITRNGYRTAMQGHVGWPDIVLAGHGRLLVVELKKDGRKPTLEQQAWLHALADAGTEAFVCYVPSGLGDLLDMLTRKDAA
jgi:hypothetical protein